MTLFSFSVFAKATINLISVAIANTLERAIGFKNLKIAHTSITHSQKGYALKLTLIQTNRN